MTLILDWQPLPGQISESQARFSELDRAHAAQRRVDSEVVVPVDVVRQLDLQLAGVRERLAVRELGLQYLVGRFVHDVVVGAPLLGERPPHVEGVEQAVDLRVVEFAAAVRMEHLDVGNREIQGREGRSDQVRVFPWAGGMAHYLSVAQVDEQADVIPSAADAHVRQVAAHVRARGAPPEAPCHDVGRIGLVGLAGMDLESLPAVGARQAVFPHDTANPAPADRFARPSQRRLYLARAVAAAARLVDRQHVGLDGVGRLRRVCPRAHGAVGRPWHAEDIALRRYRAAAGVRRYHRHFRANISAACFKTSTSMRSLRFSRSSSMTLVWSGVRLSAAWGDPVAFIDVIHLRTVDLPRSHSAMISLMGLPALHSSTTCRLKSSLKCRGCLGSAMALSVRNGPHGTVQISVANPPTPTARACSATGWTRGATPP